jgi:septum formation protein
MRLVLASASPRRRALLPLLGIPFEVAEPGVEELTEGEPTEVVLRNAELKARAVGADEATPPGAWVLGSDTDVVIDGVVLGKPEDAEQARERLRLLAGRRHEVHSGVWLLRVDPDGLPEAGSGAVETTVVRFRELSEAEIDAYVATVEWRGRAGGYAVQGFGSSLIAGIDGDLSNVIGLPLPLTARLIANLQDDSETV